MVLIETSKAILIVLMLFMVAVFITGCGIKDDIVGTWQGNNGSSFQFYKDGTITTPGLLGNSTGTYSFPDDQHIKFSFGGFAGLFGDQTYGIKVSGDTMTLENSNGGSVQMKKEK